MLQITDYTSYDEIRAILGVSETELADDVLGLPLIAYNLEATLDSVSEEVIPQYVAVKAKPEADRTRLETRFFGVVQVFAGYAAAKDLLASETRFALKKLTDGKATAERFSSDNKMLVEGVMLGYYQALARLKAVLEAMGLIVVVPYAGRTMFGKAGLVSDPVTGV